jgi:hypothetical protein
MEFHMSIAGAFCQFIDQKREIGMTENVQLGMINDPKMGMSLLSLSLRRSLFHTNFALREVYLRRFFARNALPKVFAEMLIAYVVHFVVSRSIDMVFVKASIQLTAQWPAFVSRRLKVGGWSGGDTPFVLLNRIAFSELWSCSKHMAECKIFAETGRHRIQPDLASEQRLRRIEPLAEWSDLYRRHKTASPGRGRFSLGGNHQQIGLHSRSVCGPKNSNASLTSALLATESNNLSLCLEISLALYLRYESVLRPMLFQSSPARRSRVWLTTPLSRQQKSCR